MERPPTLAPPRILGPSIRRVMLADFRSYASLDLAVEGQLVVLVGDNGAGKTNLLEALSLFSPGRGLRGADLGEMARDGNGRWAVSLSLAADGDEVQLGTGIEAQAVGNPVRHYRLQRAPIPSARSFGEYVRIIWVTPAMDGLFTGSPGDRRRFLDRLVLAVDAEHAARVNALERALRNRNRLLEDGTLDTHWLNAAEREVAELAVAVAAARVETVSRLGALITSERDPNSVFPWADVHLSGTLEALIPTRPALEVEEEYRATLKDWRARDAAAGRTLIGPQASDLIVRHGPKGVEASSASTGEQKALLVGLVLAHARLVAAMNARPPIVLLDEIAAHFDPRRRGALFEALERLGSQVWMSGADAAAFADISGRAEIFDVASGRVVRRP